MAKLGDTASGEAENWLLRQIRLFFLALQFFTRLPIPHWVGFREEWMGQTARFFPLIGWLVGATAAVVVWGAAHILPPVPCVLLALIAGVLLTGGLHEDGFADVCDGFGGAVAREPVIEIMRDSRIGVYGALGIGLLMALKLSCIATMLPIAAAAILAAHPLSRALAASLIWRLDYVGGEGKAAQVARGMSGSGMLFAACCGVLPMLLLIYLSVLPWQAVLAGSILGVLATLYLTRLFVRRIGGYTGDCLGAVQQLSETGFYLGLSSWYFSTNLGHSL